MNTNLTSDYTQFFTGDENPIVHFFSDTVCIVVLEIDGHYHWYTTRWHFCALLALSQLDIKSITNLWIANKTGIKDEVPEVTYVIEYRDDLISDFNPKIKGSVSSVVIGLKSDLNWLILGWERKGKLHLLKPLAVSA